MTVCIAAICDNGKVVACATDRMYSNQTISFEPNITKIWVLTSSIFVLIAGDNGIQTEILQAVSSEVNGLIAKDPDKWLTVSNVAQAYLQHYRQCVLKRAEQTILVPRGLTFEQYWSLSPSFHPEFIRIIDAHFATSRPLAIEALIVGCDEGGAQIYQFSNGQLSCQTGMGFACIGSGATHASSSLMSAGHTREVDGSQALCHAHRAKKHAEVTPSVGRVTDMLLIGPALGVHWIVDNQVIQILDEQWIQLKNAEREAANQNASNIRGQVYEYLLNKIAATQTPSDEKQGPLDLTDSGNSSANDDV
jgi:20S proteasome alpha/beta subunit